MRRTSPPSGPPSRRARPLLTTLPAGTRLWRIHPTAHDSESGTVEDDGTLFNPGLDPPTRFAPLSDSQGVAVPTIYLAASRRGVLYETFLHDQMPRSVVDSVAIGYGKGLDWADTVGEDGGVWASCRC